MSQNNKGQFKKGSYLHPHHKKMLSKYPNLVFDIDNGISYCRDFHLKSGLHNTRKGGVSF